MGNTNFNFDFNNFKRPSLKDLIYLAISLAAAIAMYFLLPDDGGAASLAAAMIVTGAGGGKSVVDGPLTTTLTAEGSPSLLRNEIDNRVVKIRPMATPVDQISRCIGARPSGSMVVEYYSVDTKETGSTLKSAPDPEAYTYKDGVATFELEVEKGEIFAPTETVLLPRMEIGIAMVQPVLYVSGRQGGKLMVLCPGLDENGVADMLSKLKAGDRVERMGRAAAELDVMTEQFEALPVKASNNCQIFKAQVEQSTYQKIANKEVGWSFSDQEEVAIMDMRLGMEKSFIFGQRGRFTDPVKHEEVLLTGGIWNQMDKVWLYDRGALTTDGIVKMMRTAFTGNCGSSRKVLVAGSGLIEQLNCLEYNKVVSAGETVVKWGLDFSELVSKFGRLYVVHSEVFDCCGHTDDGMIIDPEYITKYTHVPFKTERLDLKKSGVRNTEAVVVTESSCLVLRYPSAHCRVIAA